VKLAKEEEDVRGGDRHAGGIIVLWYNNI